MTLLNPLCWLRGVGRLRGAVSVGLCCLMQAFGSAQALEPGDVLVATIDPDAGTIPLIEIDAATGDRNYVIPPPSDFAFFTAFTLGSDGMIYTADTLNRVIRIDLETGRQTSVSVPGVGDWTGPAFTKPSAITLGPGGDLFVVDTEAKAVFRVDPDTGNRAFISSTNGTPVGQGPDFGSLGGITFGPDGRLFVADNAMDAPAIFSIDLQTGDRSVLASNGAGQAPELRGPAGLAFDDAGSLIAADFRAGSLLSIDPDTGDRTAISSLTMGSGPSWAFPSSIAIEDDGHILVAERFTGDLFRVDPTTGARELVSSFNQQVGTGPDFSGSRGLAIVPEPATLGSPDLNGDGFVGAGDLDLMLSVWNKQLGPGENDSADLNGDGFIGAGDLDVLLAVWNQQVGGLRGDINADGFVGAGDLDRLLLDWNTLIEPGDPAAGADLNGDGFIGSGDLDLLLSNWNAGSPPPTTAPEPASAALLALALGFALARRGGIGADRGEPTPRGPSR